MFILHLIPSELFISSPNTSHATLHIAAPHYSLTISKLEYYNYLLVVLLLLPLIVTGIYPAHQYRHPDDSCYMLHRCRFAYSVYSAWCLLTRHANGSVANIRKPSAGLFHWSTIICFTRNRFSALPFHTVPCLLLCCANKAQSAQDLPCIYRSIEP